MAKDHIVDYDTTAANNTDIDGVSVAEGMAPGNVNDAMREILADLAEWYGDTGGALVSAGASGAYTLTTNDSLAAYAQAQMYAFEANHAMPDTATATLNVNAIGAKALRKNVSVNLELNDIKAKQIVVVAYEATDDVFQIVAPIGKASVAQGKHALMVPATSMSPAVTSGCSGPATNETSVQKVNYPSLNFDAAADEYAYFVLPMPTMWDEGTITFRAYWAHPAATAFNVVWGLQAVAFGDSDAIDTAYGTAQTVTDSGGTTEDTFISDESAAITVAGTPVAGDMVMFRVYRDADNVADTLDVDAQLMGLKVFITVDAGQEA